MLAQQAFLRLVEFTLRLHDQEEIVAAARQQAISHRARNVDVVALFEIHGTEVGLEGTFAAMHEYQLVAIGIAVVERHGLGAPRNKERHVVIAQECHGRAVRITLIRGRELI